MASTDASSPAVVSAAVVATTNGQASGLPHLKIVDKVAELPLVHSAVDMATEKYAALKDSNSLVNSALDTAEKSIQLVVNKGVAPVLNKLETPIKFADNLAVASLDLAVSKTTELADSASKMVAQTNEKLCEARATLRTTADTAVESAKTLTRAAGTTVPMLQPILNLGESALDYLKSDASSNTTTTAAEVKPEEEVFHDSIATTTENALAKS